MTETRIYITSDELRELEQLAASWADEHAQRTAETGIGPLSHDYARLAGMLRGIRRGNLQEETR